MQAVFGTLSIQALAAQTFGLYIGLIYFAPVVGGWLGDRLTGRRRAVLAGATLMAAGHFLMAFEQSFLVALSALILGSGLLKGNLAAQVGGLYAKDDTRRDSAFSLYCMAINVGAFIAPLVCGTLGELYGWHYGFGVAGLGMLVGIAIYLSGSQYLPPDRTFSDREPRPLDCEHVLVLSDHSRMHPHAMFAKLKQQAGYFNRQPQTLAGLLKGEDQPLKDRLAWGRMRMDPTDISDVTGAAYTYLVNGHGPNDNWTALFRPGERVRLRFIAASSMTIFNVRIPGLRLHVVQADGQNVRPVEVDEFQITPGETYDVIVTPREERAFTIVAEAVDRSGLARATLAPRPGMAAEVPPLRKRPIATMRDMGMDMSAMDHGSAVNPDAMPGMDHGPMMGMEHGNNSASMKMRDPANAPAVALGPGVQTISPMPANRTSEPGTGLADVGHKVLVYRDLVALEANPDVRGAAREIEVHLTGNMERYMWSFDGKTLSEAREPIPIGAGERVRFTLINDTMMNHPIHLHGHLFELATGHGDHSPRKHTVNVAPGGKVSWDVTGIPGEWAFHCHMFFHMHAGMMRVVQVRPIPGVDV